MRTTPDIGLVGCGNWGRFILRDLVALGCRVTVVARSEESCRRAAEQGAAAIVPSLGELPPVDGVVVATPTATHAEVIEAVLPRGVPVFVEKPLTNDAPAAERLAGLAPDRLFVMDKWRYHPGVEALRAIARSGELGPVLGLRTHRLAWDASHHDPDDLWILAPHDLCIALEVLGEIPAPLAAVAEALNGHAVGMVALLGKRPWFVFEVSHRHREHRRDIRLHCQEGVAVLPDAYSEHLVITRGTGLGDQDAYESEELRPISTEMPLLRELRAFVQHLGGGPPPRSSAAEGATIVKTLAVLRQMAGLDGGTGDPGGGGPEPTDNP